MNVKKFRVILVFFTVCLGSACIAQEDLSTKYNEYFSQPREVVYVHLNKTDFVKGEMIGFKAYVFDKSAKYLSKNTRNLYCVISDSKGNSIKESMLLVENGVAYSTFAIDSLFSSGEYQFKAYTNWMRNFDETNYFSTVISILDTEEVKSETELQEQVTNPNIQVRPEGGYLVNNITCNLGVVAKSEDGRPLKNAEVFLINEKKDTLSVSHLNPFGIGKMLIRPKLNEEYKIVVKYGYTYYETRVPEAKKLGVAMSINDLNENLFITLNTNKKSLEHLSSKKFKLVIHNGDLLIEENIVFNERLKVDIQVDKERLGSGSNIVTLFNEKKQPLLERIFFNDSGIDLVNPIEVISKRNTDSMTASFKIKDYNPEKLSSLSVSILPSGTKSYNARTTLLSKLYLEPYVSGFISDLDYYFSDISKKKTYELNNLLLTQGYSSYDWDDILGSPSVTKFNFEQGINLTASVNRADTNQFLIQPLSKSRSMIVDLPEGERKFQVNGLYPLNDDKLVINGIMAKGKMTKPGLYTTLVPNSVPKWELPFDRNNKVIQKELLYDKTDAVFTLTQDVTQLSEVEIIANKEKIRKEKIEKNAFGKVFHVDKALSDSNVSFANWLSTQGYTVVEDVTQNPMLQIRLARRTNFNSNGAVPLIIFDGVPLRGGSINILYKLSMADIDYIDFDRLGISAPFGGQNFGGVIRIKTNTEIKAAKRIFSGMLIRDIDLTFTYGKKYYTPLYAQYSGRFFEEKGVLAWEPNVEIKEDGTVNISYTGLYTDDINIYIEGIVNDSSFVSEHKRIETN